VKLPFRQLKTAFFTHFAFYDQLLDLKALFVVPPAGGSTVALEWRPVSLEVVTDYMRRQSGSDDRVCRIPVGSVTAAFGDAVSLSFDELVFRLLRDEGLASGLASSPGTAQSHMWQPRDSPEVRCSGACSG